MKKIFFPLIVITLVFSSFVFSPNLVQGQTSTGQGNEPTSTGQGNKQNDTKTVQVNVKIDNPIGKIDSIDGLIAQLVKLALLIGVPILVLAFIWIGFLFVKAQGKPDEIKKVKGFLLWTIVGAFLLLGASVLATAIQGTVDQLR